MFSISISSLVWSFLQRNTKIHSPLHTICLKNNHNSIHRKTKTRIWDGYTALETTQTFAFSPFLSFLSPLFILSHMFMPHSLSAHSAYQHLSQHRNTPTFPMTKKIGKRIRSTVETCFPPRPETQQLLLLSPCFSHPLYSLSSWFSLWLVSWLQRDKRVCFLCSIAQPHK